MGKKMKKEGLHALVSKKKDKSKDKDHSFQEMTKTAIIILGIAIIAVIFFYPGSVSQDDEGTQEITTDTTISGNNQQTIQNNPLTKEEQIKTQTGKESSTTQVEQIQREDENLNASRIYSPYKIFKDIYWIDAPGNIRARGAYALNTSKGFVLIDTGCNKGLKQLIKNLKTIGVNPNKIFHVLNTHGHGDHCGGNEYFQKKGAKIVIHEDDVEALQTGDEQLYCKYCCPKGLNPVTPDIILKNRQKLNYKDKKLIVKYFPGHTPGSVIFLFRTNYSNSSINIYFTGDTLLGPGWYAHWLGNKYSNLTQFASSVKRLEKETLKDPEDDKYLIIPGHIKPHKEWTFKITDRTDFLKNLKVIHKKILLRKNATGDIL